MIALRGSVGTWLLAAGAATGVAVAGVSLLSREPDVGKLPDGVVAVVDGHPITRERYEQALRAVAVDRRGPLTRTDRHKVLDRLVDEQLLVEHGLDLGLANRDRRVRADLSGAVIALVTARADDDEANVTDAQLRSFFESHREWFRRLPRVRIEQLFFRVGAGGDDAARHRAEHALARWKAGAPFARLEADADPFDVPLPDGAVTLGKLEDYLGPTVLRGVAGAAEGEVVGPLRSGNGYHVVRVVERRPGEVPRFEDVRDEVRAEHRRRAGERRLHALLEAQRRAARIRVARGVL